MASNVNRRDIGQNQIGNLGMINQGNIGRDLHYHLQNPASQREPVHVISYPRNKNVVDRHDISKRLDALLPQEATSSSAALWGLGGSGKTQIALNWAYRPSETPNCSVFWVHADSDASFTNDFKTIGAQLKLDKNLDNDNFLRAVRSEIEASPPWALVIDNADDLKLFGVTNDVNSVKCSFLDYIPHQGGTVLWTSRDEQIVGSLVDSFSGIKVSVLTPDEAEELLVSMRSGKRNEEKRERTQLLEELQWHALAISQAGAFMRRTRMTAGIYLNLINEGKERWSILKMGNYDRHRRPEAPNSVLETWRISINRIRQEIQLAYNILHVIAFLDSENIWNEILVGAAHETNGPETTQLQILQAITRLREFSFLSERRTANHILAYDMHKLVQEATRYGLSFGDDSPPKTVPTTTQNKETYYSSVAVGVMKKLFPLGQHHSRKVRPRCEKYIAHALRLGDFVEVSDSKCTTADILERVSNFLFHRGRYAERKPLCERILQLRRDALGNCHKATIRSIGNVAYSYRLQGSYSEAHKLLSERLTLARRLSGDEDLLTMKAMTDIALTFFDEGQYNDAERLHEETLKLQLDILGLRHNYTLVNMEGLGAVYAAQGRFDEAERLVIKALKVREEVFGSKDQRTLKCMRAWGKLLWEQCRFKESEDTYARVLDISRDVLGENHSDTYTAMYSLANSRYAQGNSEEAIALMTKCHQGTLELLGTDHWSTKKAEARLGDWSSKD